MDEVARRQRAKRIGGAIGGILVGVLMALFLHPEGLSQQGCYVLAILAGSIVWWICGVLPEFATALIMVMLFALVGGIPAVTSFSFFLFLLQTFLFLLFCLSSSCFFFLSLGLIMISF